MNNSPFVLPFAQLLQMPVARQYQIIKSMNTRYRQLDIDALDVVVHSLWRLVLGSPVFAEIELEVLGNAVSLHT